MNKRHFCNHKDPPFDMKHQLMPADPLPVVKIDLSTKANFHDFSATFTNFKIWLQNHFCQWFELGNPTSYAI